MNKFDNTYIDVSGKSPSEIYEIAKKYSEVSGIEINGEDGEDGCFDYEWEYLCCRLGGNFSYTIIYVTDKYLPENPKQITEEDLDDYLKLQEKAMNLFKPQTKVFPKDSQEAMEILEEAKKQGWGGLADSDCFNFVLEDKESLVIYFQGGCVEFDNAKDDSYPDYKTFKWPMKTPQELPEEFIITNADNLPVRQWLKDLGYTWSTGDDLTQYDLELSTLGCCYGNYKMEHSSLEFYKREFPDLPTITPNISVTGFDITYPTPEKSVKEIEIENMKKQIFEMQESLKKLESEG